LRCFGLDLLQQLLSLPAAAWHLQPWLLQTLPQQLQLLLCLHACRVVLLLSTVETLFDNPHTLLHCGQPLLQLLLLALQHLFQAARAAAAVFQQASTECAETA
jgi:hypothetical protein